MKLNPNQSEKTIWRQTVYKLVAQAFDEYCRKEEEMKKETFNKEDLKKAEKIANDLMEKGVMPNEKALRLGIEVVADSKGVIVRMISPEAPPALHLEIPNEGDVIELDNNAVVDFFTRMRDNYELTRLFIDNYPLLVMGMAGYANRPSIAVEELKQKIEQSANFPNAVAEKIQSLVREGDMVRFYRIIMTLATVDYLCIDNGSLGDRVEEDYKDCIGIEYTFTTQKPIYDKEECIAHELNFEYLIVTGLQDPRVKSSNLPKIVQHEFIHGVLDTIFSQMYELEDYRNMLGNDGLYYMIEFLCDFIPYDKMTFNRYSKNPLNEMEENLSEYPNDYQVIYKKIIAALRPYYNELIPEK